MAIYTERKSIGRRFAQINADKVKISVNLRSSASRQNHCFEVRAVHVFFEYLSDSSADGATVTPGGWDERAGEER